MQPARCCFQTRSVCGLYDDLADAEDFKRLELAALRSAEAAVAGLTEDDQEIVKDAGGVRGAVSRSPASGRTRRSECDQPCPSLSRAAKRVLLSKFDAVMLREKIAVCERLGLNHFGDPIIAGPGLISTLERLVERRQAGSLNRRQIQTARQTIGRVGR